MRDYFGNDIEYCLDELIPANPTRRTAQSDPRPPQVCAYVRHDGRKTEVTVDGDSVIVHCYENPPMPESELKFVLAAARKAGTVRSLTLRLDKSVAAEHYSWLASKNFDRDSSRDTRGDPSLAWTKSYVKNPKVEKPETQIQTESNATRVLRDAEKLLKKLKAKK